MSTLPHYLLQTETIRSSRGARRWKFVLQHVGSDERLNASDAEPATDRSRLELLAVVRGLEALSQPARVTLLTQSRYVSQGFRRQLSQWRDHKWRWEKFGSMSPIRNSDLWRRIDRALEYHSVECCELQADVAAQCEGRGAGQAANWSLSAAFGKLGRGVLSPLSALLRPSFTRAA